MQKSFKLYLNPKETKNCELCGKEIDKKWKDDLCLLCRDKLKLYPEQLKDIAEIFKIINGDKNPQKSGEGKMAKGKTKTKQAVSEDRKLITTFYESELEYLGLKSDAHPIELATVVRAKFGIPARVKQTKRKELKEKLGLPADATQKDINEAMIKKLETE